MFLRAGRHPLRTWWQRVDRLSVMLILAIMALGCLVLITASTAVASDFNVSVWHFAQRQLLFIAASLPLMLLFSSFTLERLKLIALVLLIGALVGVALTLVMGEGVKGATRWVAIGGFKVQPSEFLKPALVLVTAWLFAHPEPQQARRNFVVSLALMALVTILLLLQPNFGMWLIIAAVWGGQAFLAGYPFLWLVGLGGAGATLAASAYFIFDHVRSRVDRFLDPSSGDTFQVDQAQEALISGGFVGRGPGEGVVKHSLPDAHTDFIFAVIGEEFGLLACSVLLLLYGVLMWRLFGRLLQQPDRFTLLAGLGLLLVFGAQVLINAGVVLHLLPTTGVTLPFMSYGGSSTFAMAIIFGILLALTRQGELHAQPHWPHRAAHRDTQRSD